MAQIKPYTRPMRLCGIKGGKDILEVLRWDTRAVIGDIHQQGAILFRQAGGDGDDTAAFDGLHGVQDDIEKHLIQGRRFWQSAAGGFPPDQRGWKCPCRASGGR